ncbi:SWIM zinc finger domain-containing protein [Pendulispora brunnea]|uniref:SWIM zinc finger domain-containing protein n=1 Tax=Pendulispora brunnea TaxID=2905690 RepID=A0ABZ2JWM1_9BACT
MNLSVEQVLGLAPDSNAASAGRKLGVASSWKGLARSERALWGECQGSALYRVCVDPDTMASKCTCPSRKFPCKHALGLMLLAAGSLGAFSTGTEPPAWVLEWVERRTASAERKKEKEAEPAKTPDPAEQAKRAERRRQRVVKGIEGLDLWMSDLIRQGLAQVEDRPAAFWEGQAARLVDAQAPGLASRVRRLGRYVGNHVSDWPVKLLGEMGRIALLTHAFRRIEELPAPLQADVRQLIGWSLSHEEILTSGEAVQDAWLLAGQSLFDEERFRVQRNWLVGTHTGRVALFLQFAAGTAPFAENMMPGTVFDAELVYRPSAFPQRALIRANPAKERAPRAWSERLPGFDRIESFRIWYAEALALLPWLERTFAGLRGVTPVRTAVGACIVRDAEGGALPLVRNDAWTLFALSGGESIDLAAEWNGEALTPIAVMHKGEYHVIPAPADDEEDA